MTTRPRVMKVRNMQKVSPKNNTHCTACKRFETCAGGKVCEPLRGKNGSKTGMLVVVDKLTTHDLNADNIFAGDPGRKLSYVLEHFKLTSKDVWKSALVRCTGNKNQTRKPSKKERDACFPHLLFEILALKPKVIMAMGADVEKYLLDEDGSKDSDFNKRRGYAYKKTFISRELISEEVWEEIPNPPKSRRKTKKKVLVKEAVYKVESHTCYVLPTYSFTHQLSPRGWPVDDVFIDDFRTGFKLCQGRYPFVKPKTELNVLDTREKLEEFFENPPVNAEYVVCDTETSGDLRETTNFDFISGKILCIGFCWEKDKAVILPINGQHMVSFWSVTDEDYIKENLRQIFPKLNLVFHNGGFDLKFLWGYLGFFKPRFVADTMAAHHCIDENLPHSLTFCLQQDLGWEKYDERINLYKDNKTFGFSKYCVCPNEELWEYLGHDVNGPLQLLPKYLDKLEQEGVMEAYQNELKQLPILAEMEFRGFRMDESYRKQQKELYMSCIEQSLSYIREWLLDYLPEEDCVVYNPNSKQQLVKAFKATGAKLDAKTASGELAVDSPVLKALSITDSPSGKFAQMIMEYKGLCKFLSTYVDGTGPDGTQSGIVWKEKGVKFNQDRGGGLSRKIHSKTGCLHTSYKALSATGRLQSAEHTLPKVGTKLDYFNFLVQGKLKPNKNGEYYLLGARPAFVPDNDTDVFLSVDYSKLELRIGAYLANCQRMATELLNGWDLHTKMALNAKFNRLVDDEVFLAYVNMMSLIESGKSDQVSEEVKDFFKGKIVSKLDRSQAKSTNFGIPYGIREHALVLNNPTDFPVDMDHEERLQLMRNLIAMYFKIYPEMAYFQAEQKYLAKKDGFIRSARVGRKRRVHTALNWYNSKYGKDTKLYKKDMASLYNALYNFPIQSLASDLLTEVTSKVYNMIELSKIPNFRVVHTIHDQLLFNVHEDYIEEASEIARKGMEVTLLPTRDYKYEMPLTVDVEVQRRFWGDGEGYDS